MFDFLGYLNTLRLLIEKVNEIIERFPSYLIVLFFQTLEACRKSFYFYCQYLDQGLFVPLALVATGSVSSLHTELMQWNKYARILYDCQMEKIVKEFGKERIEVWRKQHHFEEILGPIKKESSQLKVSPSVVSNIQSKSQTIIPAKHKQNSLTPQSKKKFVKKSKSSQGGGGDEIDDIFNDF